MGMTTLIHDWNVFEYVDLFQWVVPLYIYFSRMRRKGSRFTLWVCSLDVVRPSATVRNRPQPVRAIAIWPCHLGSCPGGVILDVSRVT